jgi:hypothetical protein
MKILDFISSPRREACLRRMRMSVKDVDPINRRRRHDDIVFDGEPMPRLRHDDAATLPGRRLSMHVLATAIRETKMAARLFCP